jgi:PASTA domain
MPDRWINPEGWGPTQDWELPHRQPTGWGSPPPGGRSSSGPWWRRWYVVLAALLMLLGVVALSDDNPTPTSASDQTAAAPTTTFSLPTVATTLATTSTAPPSTIEKVTVPRLVGMRLARAKDRLADQGLTAETTYQATGRYPAGTVISQSRKAGAGVLPDTTISLVVAKAPSPPPSTAPPAPAPTAPPRDCHPSYPDVCLRPDASDYDCEGGSGNGPAYVSGPLRVLPPDPFGLDGNDNDGWGCESG